MACIVSGSVEPPIPPGPAPRCLPAPPPGAAMGVPEISTVCDGMAESTDDSDALRLCSDIETEDEAEWYPCTVAGRTPMTWVALRRTLSFDAPCERLLPGVAGGRMEACDWRRDGARGGPISPPEAEAVRMAPPAAEGAWRDDLLLLVCIEGVADRETGEVGRDGPAMSSGCVVAIFLAAPGGGG
jgi:hypothetical protein